MSAIGWANKLLISSAITQGAIYVIRPMMTYRALELDATASTIGFIAAIYALFPVLLALTFGRMVGRVGEGRFVIFGTFFIGVSAAILLFADSLTILAIGAALSGLAHLACMVGGQTMVALKSPTDKYEEHFGRYTFSASLGQMLGPIIATLVAGSTGVIPKSTSAAFALALALSALDHGACDLMAQRCTNCGCPKGRDRHFAGSKQPLAETRYVCRSLYVTCYLFNGRYSRCLSSPLWK